MSEQRDILEQLREWRRKMPANWYGNQRLEAAADEIAGLRIELDGSAAQAANYRAQIEELSLQLAGARKALELFARHLRGSSRILADGYEINIKKSDYESIIAAMTALSDEKGTSK